MDDRIMATARYVGRAMARDVIAEGMPREWTGLDPQDADLITAYGPIDGEMWDAVATEAMWAYDDAISLREMAEMLGDYGPCDTDEAMDWVDHNFLAATAKPWCAIGVWDASTAADLRDAGLSPDDVLAAAVSLTDGMDDEDAWLSYGDGPIDAACNRDIGVDLIIDEARRLTAAD